MALHIAHEKGVDSWAGSLLATIFSEMLARMCEFHIRDFRSQAEQAAAACLFDGLSRSAMVFSRWLSEIVQCIQAHVACWVECTPAEALVVLAMIEERHRDIVVKGFTDSVEWLNVLMNECNYV